MGQNKSKRKLKDENKYLEKEVQKKEAKAKKAEELEAKNNFLNGTIERMKKTEEECRQVRQRGYADDSERTCTICMTTDR